MSIPPPPINLNIPPPTLMPSSQSFNNLNNSKCIDNEKKCTECNKNFLPLENNSFNLHIFIKY